MRPRINYTRSLCSSPRWRSVAGGLRGGQSTSRRTLESAGRCRELRRQTGFQPTPAVRAILRSMASSDDEPYPFVVIPTAAPDPDTTFLIPQLRKFSRAALPHRSTGIGRRNRHMGSAAQHAVTVLDITYQLQRGRRVAATTTVGFPPCRFTGLIEGGNRIGLGIGGWSRTNHRADGRVLLPHRGKGS